jgi:hypothetical protein
MDIHTKLSSGYYEPKVNFLPYVKYRNPQEFYSQLYFEEKQRLFKEFKKDALAHANFTDPALSERAWAYVISLKHTSLFVDIINSLEQLNYVIKGDE